MGFMNSINIIVSGLTAQQLRLDIVAENVTNSQTTRVENEKGTCRRKESGYFELPHVDMVNEISEYKLFIKHPNLEKLFKHHFSDLL